MTRVVAFGEIMGRFSPPGFQRFGQCMPGKMGVLFAGAEASVAMSIAYLGGEAAFVTALPRHEIADACVAVVRATGVDTRHILRTENGRLGLYFLEAGVNQRPGKVIYDREGASVAITPPDAYDWDAILAGADWLVVSGITPAISRCGFDVTAEAFRQAKARDIRVLCDFNYRGKLWRWDPATPPRTLAIRKIAELMPMVDLFVGGADEIGEVLSEIGSPIPIQDDGPEDSTGDAFAHAADAFQKAAGALCGRFPNLSRIASTFRRTASATRHELGGMLYETAGDRVHHAPSGQEAGGGFASYHVDPIVDRIGTGDAFTAGLLFALTTPELSDPGRAIAFATASFCLSHSIEGDFNATTRGEIEELLAGDASGRVQR
jgi:2-dehydro-3-deoxygluconokinase